MVALYQNPCKCWSLGLYYLQFPDRQSYSFMLSMTGIGWTENFGTIVVRSILNPLMIGDRGLPWAAPGGPAARHKCCSDAVDDPVATSYRPRICEVRTVRVVSEPGTVGQGVYSSMALVVTSTVAAIPAPPVEDVPPSRHLERAKVFLQARNFRQALQACDAELRSAPSAKNYVALAYVYRAVHAYLDHLAATDRVVP
ncbi:MAG: hypothetical protein U0231_16875 [Nitrospiraceae bacterium]